MPALLGHPEVHTIGGQRSPNLASANATTLGFSNTQASGLITLIPALSCRNVRIAASPASAHTRRIRLTTSSPSARNPAAITVEDSSSSATPARSHSARRCCASAGGGTS